MAGNLEHLLRRCKKSDSPHNYLKNYIEFSSWVGGKMPIPTALSDQFVGGSLLASSASAERAHDLKTAAWNGRV